MTLARDAAAPAVDARPLILLLPGALGTATEVAVAGFGDSIGQRAPGVAFEVAELAMEHVTDRAVIERLAARVRAARSAGAPAIWLAGISLGAFVALAFAERFPGEVDGLCLLAPYLGTRLVTGEVARAGGARAWAAAGITDDDEERRVWRFIASGRLASLPLFIGLGRDDRFGDSQRLLLEVVPADAIEIIDGGHDWPTWRALWNRFVDRWPSRRAPARQSSAS